MKGNYRGYVDENTSQFAGKFSVILGHQAGYRQKTFASLQIGPEEEAKCYVERNVNSDLSRLPHKLCYRNSQNWLAHRQSATCGSGFSIPKSVSCYFT